jgi:hypothetical protein
MFRKKEWIAMLLAGGQGSRLYTLTQNLAKPAVPFGGKYRIIDFPLSNCVNSGIDTVGVLTQYQPLILNEYIGNGQPWDLDRSNGGVFVLPPYQKSSGSDWYTGTANAIYQNINFIERYDPEYVLILSGDHIYKMNHFTDSFREKRKPFRIVIEAIDTAIALKVVFIIEKIIFNAAIACFKDAAVLVAPTKRYVEITDKFHLLAQFRFDCAVQRDHHPARVLLAADRAWQGPRHIGQTAGCNEGRRLRCNIQDSHLQIPPLKRLLAVNFLHG